MEKFKVFSYEGLSRSKKKDRSATALNVMMFIFGASMFIACLFLWSFL